jgi:hypothetical protein
MQTFLVILLIVAALAYLGWRAYGVFSRKTQKGCEKCGISENLEQKDNVDQV